MPHARPVYNQDPEPGDAWYGDDPDPDSVAVSELAAEADGAQRDLEFTPHVEETQAEANTRLDAETPAPELLALSDRQDEIRTTISGFTQTHDPLA